MVMEDLKLLVVGIGSIGKRHSDVLYSMLGCRNITIWDPLPERAKEHAAKYPGMQTVATLEEGLALPLPCICVRRKWPFWQAAM